MKKLLIILFVILFAGTASAAEKITLTDDNDTGNGYYSNPKARKMWEEFSRETDYLFGYGSRSAQIVYGKITGGDCRDNKSFFVGAINWSPEYIAKGLLHVDAVCEGKHLLGNLDYAVDMNPQRQHFKLQQEGDDMWHYFLGMLNDNGENVETGAEVKYKWKWSFEKPEEESVGNVVIFERRNPKRIDLGSFAAHTMAWQHDNPFKNEARPDWAKE